MEKVAIATVPTTIRNMANTDFHLPAQFITLCTKAVIAGLHCCIMIRGIKFDKRIS